MAQGGHSVLSSGTGYSQRFGAERLILNISVLFYFCVFLFYFYEYCMPNVLLLQYFAKKISG